MTRTRYVALLRGINVGGRNVIKMDSLRAALAGAGLANVRTLLASGNVAFDADETETSVLWSSVEATLLAAFGRPISVLLRTVREVQDLIDAAPFAGIEVTPQTRLYVSFLSEPAAPVVTTPYRPLQAAFTILRISPKEVCSVLTLDRTDSVSAMQELEKLFGRRITTRNWNTVVKLAAF